MILEINSLCVQPIYEQLRDQIVLGIASGQFSPGESLPSVRRLASDIGVNLHTVNKAYTVLCDEGYIVMDRRKGATVSQSIPISDNNVFWENLKRRVSMAAAEARCRKMREDEFIELCSNCYRNTGGGINNE